MDPNEALKIIRGGVERILVDVHHSDPHAVELAEYVQGLDEWLSRGGFLPQEWGLNRKVIFEIKDIDLALLSDALLGARTVRFAVDGGKLKYKINEHTWTAGINPEGGPILSAQPCRYEFDGKDTDGTDWWHCLTHDELAPSRDGQCAGASSGAGVGAYDGTDKDEWINERVASYRADGEDHSTATRWAVRDWYAMYPDREDAAEDDE